MLFISYPVNAHYIPFSTYNFEVSIGWLVTTIATCMISKNLIYKESKCFFICGIGALVFGISVYQPFVSVYAVGVSLIIFIFIIKELERENDIKLKQIIILISKFVGTLIVSLIIYYIILKLIQVNIPSNGYVETFIKTEGVSQLFSNAITWLKQLIYGNKVYGGEVLGVTIPIMILICFILIIRNKLKRSWIVLIPLLGALCSPFRICILGSEFSLRTLQGVTVVISVVGWIVVW